MVTMPLDVRKWLQERAKYEIVRTMRERMERETEASASGAA
jgi:hypothetical protein